MHPRLLIESLIWLTRNISFKAWLKLEKSSRTLTMILYVVNFVKQTFKGRQGKLT